jgi:ribosomal protein S18 acetylase RimI-like enzyme
VLIEDAFAARVTGDAAVAGTALEIPGGVLLRSELALRDLNAALLGPTSTDADLAAALARHEIPRVTVFRDIAVPAGWEAVRLVLMGWPGAVPGVPGGPEAVTLATVRPEPLSDAFDAAGAQVFALSADGEWIAWAMVIEGCIDDVWVQEPFRGRGHGRAVTQAALAAGGWFLWCLEDDPVPCGLYGSMGFCELGIVVQLSRVAG